MFQRKPVQPYDWLVMLYAFSALTFHRIQRMIRLRNILRNVQLRRFFLNWKESCKDEESNFCLLRIIGASVWYQVTFFPFIVDMSRNACRKENGRFNHILWTILTGLAKFVNLEISTKLWTSEYMTWLKGAQKVDEFGESDEFVKSDDSDEISPRL